MKLKQHAFFRKRLGAALRNNQWSWGAFDPVSNRVFLRVWKNQIETNGNGERVVVLGQDWERDRHGYPERLKHIEAIEKGAEGIGVLCERRVAKDGSVHIKDYDDEVLVRLSGFSRENGTIYVGIVGRFPIGELATKAANFRNGISIQKITRLSYNSRDWQRPSGDAKKYEAPGTYNHKHGFGHEEWLFRSEWLVDGWRYAFIQGVNKSVRKLIAAQEAFDLTLFTIEPDKRRRYVGIIRDIECLGDEQAKAAVRIFKEAGWFDTMLKEIKEVGGDAEALGNSPEAKHILNVRFRLENVVRFKPNQFADRNDPIMGLKRYQVHDFNEIEQKTDSPTFRHRKGSESPPPAKKILRQATAATEYTPEHTLMQKKLLTELRKEFPEAQVIAERDFVDVSVLSKKELLLFEIKSDLNPRVVIRQALGQVLEYAFHPQRIQTLPIRLVIVGRRPLSANETCYLDCLRRKFRLPLQYRVVAI